MDFTFIAPLGAVIALVFALILSRRVMKASEGNSTMQKIALAIRKGANAYLKRQYKGVIIFFIVMFVILLILALCGLLSFFVPFAFLTGGFFSGLAGFIGMKIATASNARTANASQTSLNAGLKIAFSGGAVVGFVVVGLGLLFVVGWYFILTLWFNDPDRKSVV